MNVGMMVGAAAASRRSSAQKHITQRLRDAGAIHRDTAQPLPDVGASHKKEMERLIEKGVIRQARPGLYYLDEAAMRDQRATALRVAWVLAVLSAGLVAFMTLLG
jgi:hypothetical protein